MLRTMLSFFAAVAMTCAPTAALAHAKLVSASPASNASVSAPTTLTLVFSEPIVAPLSGVEIAMTGMPGMANHKPMPIKGIETRVEGKTIKVVLARALPTGTYSVKWHVVSGDQHRIEGTYSFKVA